MTLSRTFLFAGLVLLGTQANAAPIYWNTWQSSTAGSISSPDGDVAVSFAGPSAAYIANYPGWGPSASYADGLAVDNGPVAANGILQLLGGSDALNVVRFSTPVLNPVMSLWSLGQTSIPVTFAFQNATPTWVAGGPSDEYGGSAISVLGNVVTGAEGNGTVQFFGTFSSLEWTNPQFENWYGFNVGIPAVASAVPLPAAVWLLGGALGGLGALRRRSA